MPEDRNQTVMNPGIYYPQSLVNVITLTLGGIKA